MTDGGRFLPPYFYPEQKEKEAMTTEELRESLLMTPKNGFTRITD